MRTCSTPARSRNGTLYVVFELLEGEDLAAAIAQGRIGLRRLLVVGMQVLEGLEVAHAARIVHRDIKPANIFLVRRFGGKTQAKILDFGVACMTHRKNDDRLTQAGVVVGTPYFMSPEQMCGEQVDGRADLWSAGVVLYLALCGKLPFSGKNYAALLAEMVRSGPPSLASQRPDLPSALTDAIGRALHPDLSARFQSARSMRLALDAVLRGVEPAGPGLGPALERGGPSTNAHPPQRHGVAEPPQPAWERALADIEGEIDRLKKDDDRPETKPPRPSFKASFNPFRKKRK